METEAASGVMDVPGQATEPALAEARPQHQADEGDAYAENEQHLAQFVHAMLSLIPNGRFLKAETARVKSAVIVAAPGAQPNSTGGDEIVPVPTTGDMQGTGLLLPLGRRYDLSLFSCRRVSKRPE